MKDVLKWIPIVSIVGWALDMPFLKRYSKEQVEKNPSLRGKDLEQMKKAFKRLETNPGTVLSFAEGTRFTKLKHDDQQSPFKNLLRPKAGGIGIALSTMPFHYYFTGFLVLVMNLRLKAFGIFFVEECQLLVSRLE